jgi:putative transposase
MTRRSPFQDFKTSLEIIRLAVMLYVRYPMSLRNVEDLLNERGIEIRHATIRFRWSRFCPMFAASGSSGRSPCPTGVGIPREFS